jgi:hypothetical protein
MADIQWDSEASLMRVIAFATTDSQEELLARGTLRQLVGTVLAMDPAAQDGLLLRAAGADWTEEFDSDAIRELAARPEFTGAAGAFDTAEREDDEEEQDEAG